MPGDKCARGDAEGEPSRKETPPGEWRAPEDHPRPPRRQGFSEDAVAVGLAHAIRNPLNGASLHLSILERELACSPFVSHSSHEALDVARSELRRLASFVSDFMSATRPGRLDRAPVDLNESVHRVLGQLQREADPRGIELRCELPVAPVVASLDRDRIESALLHLVQNAIDAVVRDGRVVVRVRQTASDVEVEVEDCGAGVPSGDPPIFDAFYTTKPAGTGLGLTIVHRTAAAHGGDVTYRSVPGCTVFRLRLPLRHDVR